MKKNDPYIIKKGVEFISRWMELNGYQNVQQSDRYVVGETSKKRVGGYVVPRDHELEPNSHPMLHRELEMKSIHSLMSSKRLNECYLLVARLFRNSASIEDINFTHSAMILIPHRTFTAIFDKQMTMNIGTTERQRSKWTKQEFGVQYFPFLG